MAARWLAFYTALNVLALTLEVDRDVAHWTATHAPIELGLIAVYEVFYFVVWHRPASRAAATFRSVAGRQEPWLKQPPEGTRASEADRWEPRARRGDVE